MAEKKSVKKKSKKVDKSDQYMAGLTMAGFLMASSNGEIADEEYEVLAQVVAGFVEGSTYEQVNELLEAQSAELDEKGWDDCVAGLAAMIDSDEIKDLALELSAMVALSDGDFSPDQEGEAYLSLADGLGVDREKAQQIFEQVADELNS
jgi:tellurite resistance protein